jgi:tetratricopeptide (TPR) repeat protein
MSFLKKFSDWRSEKHRSVQMLRSGINDYAGPNIVRKNAADTFESLAELVDKLPEKEFGALRKEIPQLVILDRGRLTSIVISGGLTSKQFESIVSRAEVKSHLLYSAGFCRTTQLPADFIRAIQLLETALRVRPKPKTYVLREVQPDIKALSVKVIDKPVNFQSFHVASIVSEGYTNEVADEVTSFRDTEFFGLTYLGLGRALLQSRGDLEKSLKCYDAAIWYLEKTRHFDLNILLRAACWFDKGMCNYYLSRFHEAIECYNLAQPMYESGKSRFPVPGLSLGFADCLLYKGECELRLGMHEEARENLERALETSAAIRQQDNVLRVRRLLRQLGSQEEGKSEPTQTGQAGGTFTKEQMGDLVNSICPFCGKKMRPLEPLGTFDKNIRWYCSNCNNFVVIKSSG